LDLLADNQLMLGVKAGDLDKMALLYERYASALYGFVYRSTNAAEESEDIVQTVFYRMIKYRSSFTGDGQFRTWMYHIARNVVTDAHNKKGRVDYHDDLSVLGLTIASDHDAHGDMEARQSKDLLTIAMNRLNENDREVLILSKYQELSYKEIADILDTNENNIKIKVHRAFKQLKEIFLKIQNERGI
jgi:RNA polymerase sigma factor (sigma-70 family)